MTPKMKERANMHWATTTWRVTETALGLTEAIEAWKVHCDRHHPQITGIRY